MQFELASLSDMKGVWTDISFCLDFKNKRMDAWVDGEKKVEILSSAINFMPDSIYFKYGIYRSFVSRYTNSRGSMPTQIVYYDEVRRGTLPCQTGRCRSAQRRTPSFQLRSTQVRRLLAMMSESETSSRGLRVDR